MAVAHIIDMAVWRIARDADAKPPATIASPVPSTDGLDSALNAVSAVLKTNTLDADARWRLVGIIMQSLGQRHGR